MKTNTVALCIPAYNAAAYLPRLLQSAKAQLIPFDEIWVYNDCSTDETAKVAAQYGANVINGTVNKGCSVGKNTLAEVTSCEWIHFHDADDELLPNFTTLAHRWISRPTCPDVVLFNYEYRDNHNKELLSVRHFDKAYLETDSIGYSIKEQINPFCGLYRKDAFLAAGGYDVDPEILYNEDCAMHIKIAIAGLSFSAESELSIINYRIKNSMSGANAVKCLVAQLNVAKKTINELKKKNQLINYEGLIAEKLWALAGIFGAYNKWEYSEECFFLTKQLNSRYPSASNGLFKFMCSISAELAFKIREQVIRTLKPKLREFLN